MVKAKSAETDPPPVPVAPIDPGVINDLRRILGLGQEAPVPEKVLDLYRVYKKRVDVCSAGTVGPKELILLTMLAGCPVPVSTPQKAPESKKSESIQEEF